MDFAKMLTYISEKAGITKTSRSKWDLVIDFCAYERKHVKSVIRGLSDLTKLYILISTDSVYEVCAKEFRNGPIKESDSLRPEKEEDIKKLAKEEEYGHNKLRCEEYLKSHVYETKSLPYIILRLPDVIGPYDLSYRYWKYLLWLQKNETWPIHTQAMSDTRKLSFVFSEDVAGFVHYILRQITGPKGKELISEAHGHSFNIAFDEAVTLNELLKLMVGVNHL